MNKVDVNSHTIDEAVSSQPESAEPAIFLDEDLVVCESTDILSTDDHPDAPQPPKPIPVVKAKSPDTLTLPIREKTGSTSKTRKGKCLILHECPSISVNDEKLGPFFDLECIQIQSLKGVTSKKNLQRLSNRVMDIKPTVIFINLGKSDLRHHPTTIVTQCYEKLLKSLIKVTDADICATMLQQTYGYPKQNKPVTQFNAELRKLVKHMRALKEPNGSTQIYIEDENYVSNGIGSQTELTEVFPFMEQPACSESTLSKMVLNGRNINSSTKAEPIPVVTRTVADRKGADITITRIEGDKSARPEEVEVVTPTQDEREAAEPNQCLDSGDQGLSRKPTTIPKTQENSNNSCKKAFSSKNRQDPSKVYHKRKCLVVLDNLLNDFDGEKFSSQFDVSKYRASSVKDLLTKGGLLAKARNINPETIFLHVGLHDLFWHKTDADDLVEEYKRLIHKLLESTNAKICISLIVPVPGYPGLNNNIEAVNGSLVNYIAKIRSSSKRVFTSSNKQLAGYITRGTGARGVTLFLTERGKRKAWLILKDALQRALGMNRDREKKLDLSRNTHKETNHV